MKIRFSILFSLILVLVTGITATAASDIKGKVVISIRAPQKRLSGLSAFYSKPGTLGNYIDQNDVVLYIKKISLVSKPQPIQGAKVEQIDKRFVPHLLPVTVGTTVEFPNMDEIYHNAFSLSRGNTFNLGKYALGKSKTHTFDSPGVVEVFCEIHSNMYSYIIVVPNEYFAKTDSDGNYVIKNVPPGTYTLVAWHESFPQKEYLITVTETGDIIQNIEF